MEQLEEGFGGKLAFLERQLETSFDTVNINILQF
jgi:hypothetical protein